MTFSYFRNIHLSDTDAAGVLYFAKGMSICHEAYEEWLEFNGLSIQTILLEGNFALPIVRGEIDFFKPIFCNDKLEIKLKLSEVEETKYAIAYKMFRVSDPDKLLVKALTKHVCINSQTRQRESLSKIFGVSSLI